MAFSLADELDPLDPLADSLGGLGGLGSGLGDSFGMAMGMSLADELDGPGPEDLGAIGGMGSLALELEQTFPDPNPPRAAPLKPTKTNGHGAAPSTRGGRRRSPPSNGTPPRRRAARTPSLALEPERDTAPSPAPTPSPARALNSSTSSVNEEEGVARAEAEAAAALGMMNEALASSSNLVGMLKGLDRPVGARKENGSSAGTNGKSLAATVLLEDRLQAHLARLSEAERLREEQAREAAHLARELANVRWEGLEVDLEGLSEVLASSGSPPTPGWTGETTTQAATSAPRGRRPNGFTLETIGESPPSPLSPTDPTSPISPISPVSPTSPTSPTYPASPAPRQALPQAALGLLDDTAGLTSTLSSLGESVSLSLARHAADGRTLRRARLGLRDWHEREVAEDACRRGIDVWEERVARGDVPDARAEMGRMLQGFRDALESAEAQVYALTPVREMEIGMAL